jgi:hypothetical protein
MNLRTGAGAPVLFFYLFAWNGYSISNTIGEGPIGKDIEYLCGWLVWRKVRGVRLWRGLEFSKLKYTFFRKKLRCVVAF